MFPTFFVHRSAGFFFPGTRSGHVIPCSVAFSAANYALLIGADAFASMPLSMRDLPPVLSIIVRTVPWAWCTISPYRSVSARMSSMPGLQALTSASVEFGERAVCLRTFHAMAAPFKKAATPDTHGRSSE